MGRQRDTGKRKRTDLGSLPMKSKKGKRQDSRERHRERKALRDGLLMSWLKATTYNDSHAGMGRVKPKTE
jgi:hypothetical protein